MTYLEQAAARLEAAIFQPEHLANTLHSAGEDLGFDHFCLVHANIHELQVVAAEHSMAAFKAYDAGGWVETDYRAATVNLEPTGKLYLDHLAVPEEQRLREGIYHDLYVPQQMAFFGGWRSTVADQSWIFSLARSEARGPVLPDEQRLLTGLMPIANRALGLAHQIRNARAQSINDFAASLSIPLIILGSEGRPVAITPAAEHMFDDTFGLRAGKLWAANTESDNALKQLGQAAQGRTMPAFIQNIAVKRAGGRRPLLLRPVPIRGLGLDFLPGARLLITVTDPDLAPHIREADLRLLFNLSPAQANIAALLADGRSVEEIATVRAVSIETVRTQIKHLFQKTDVTRIGELVSLLARIITRGKGRDMH
jgi:DNA-binding CsgD family transcriptional regulator